VMRLRRAREPRQVFTAPGSAESDLGPAMANRPVHHRLARISPRGRFNERREIRCRWCRNRDGWSNVDGVIHEPARKHSTPCDARELSNSQSRGIVPRFFRSAHRIVPPS
jgi:hypothetical protein